MHNGRADSSRANGENDGQKLANAMKCLIFLVRRKKKYLEIVNSSRTQSNAMTYSPARDAHSETRAFGASGRRQLLNHSSANFILDSILSLSHSRLMKNFPTTASCDRMTTTALVAGHSIKIFLNENLSCVAALLEPKSAATRRNKTEKNSVVDRKTAFRLMVASQCGAFIVDSN